MTNHETQPSNQNSIKAFQAIKDNGSFTPDWRETENQGLEGPIDTYLNQIYLLGYNQFLQKTYPHLLSADKSKEFTTQIPELINKIFSPLLERYGRYIGTVNITGELPRAMADKMNPFYWQHFEGLLKEMKIVQEQTSNQITRDFCQSSLSFSHSPDIDISFRNKQVRTISRLLKKVHGIKDNQVSNEEGGKENYILFTDKDYTAKVEIAPLRTRPKVILMVIGIEDNRTGQRVFHLDIGSFPQDAQDALIDKRVVHSVKKQDIVQAELTTKNGRLFASISKEARQAMDETNAVKKKDLASMMELVTRAMRIETMHPQEKRLNFLDRFMPQMDSESVFTMREIFRLGTNKEISQPIMFFVIKELILCLRCDPYQTVQMLRDSGLLVGTKLANLTYFDFDKILLSDSFSIEMQNKVPVPREERDEAYIRRQRKLYREQVTPNQQKYTDGLERFINALVEIGYLSESVKQDYWGSFFNVILEKNITPLKIDTYSVTENIPIISLMSLSISDRKFGLVSLDDKPLTREDITKIVEYISLQTSSLSKDISPTIDAVMRIREHALGTEFGIDITEFLLLTLNKKQKIPSELVLRHAELKNRINSIASLYLILKQHSSGITPRELMRLYESKTGNFRKLPFTQVFTELKRLGFLTRYVRQREHQMEHNIVDIDLYFLLPESASIHRLDTLINNLNPIEEQKLSRIYETQGKHDNLIHQRSRGQKENKSKIYLTIHEIISLLNLQGITLEALEAFTDKDFQFFTEAGLMNPGAIYNIKLFREALRWLYADRYLRGQSTPDVYTITFSSLDGRLIIKECKKILNDEQALLRKSTKTDLDDYQI